MVARAQFVLSVRPVRIGRGLVTSAAIPKGATVTALAGRQRSAAGVLRLWRTDPRRAANCIRSGQDTYLDPGEHFGAFSNHSCRPNAMVIRERGALFLRALRRIPAGAEITHDYATCLGADDVWTMRCDCREPGCRGRVERFDRLPAAVLRRYLAAGAIPRFILDTLEAE
jgi:hypothetical protein